MLSWDIIFLVLKWGNIVFYENIVFLPSSGNNGTFFGNSIGFSIHIPTYPTQRAYRAWNWPQDWPHEWWFAAKKETIILRERCNYFWTFKRYDKQTNCRPRDPLDPSLDFCQPCQRKPMVAFWSDAEGWVFSCGYRPWFVIATAGIDLDASNAKLYNHGSPGFEWVLDVLGIRNYMDVIPSCWKIRKERDMYKWSKFGPNHFEAGKAFALPFHNVIVREPWKAEASHFWG